MKTNHAPRDEPKMNAGLCPDDFEIKVPNDCRLLGDFRDFRDWKTYVKTLTPGGGLPDYYLNPDGSERKEDKVTCCTCEGRAARILKGQEAVAHACAVHEKIHRQALGLEQVSAIDVGFAIWERQSRFENFLSIRIHVNKKRPPEQLIQVGLASLTLPNYIVGDGSPAREFLADRKRLLLNSRPNAPNEDNSTGADRCKEAHDTQWKHLLRIMTEDQTLKELWKGLSQYPISGIHKQDLSVFCPLPLNALSTLHDVRLCICGVPIDIINATYKPSISHPGGDADRGVFVNAPQRGVELQDDELLLVGRGRANPVVGGVSVGSVADQAGTLGVVVWDRTDATPCVLSNWHVLAGSTAAQVGQPIYQPARFDGGTENDVVAHLKRWHLGEQGDAALAELGSRRHYASGEVLGLWHPISGYLQPKLNMEVRKWGRTTGFTQGFVDGIKLATNIDYGGGFVRFFRDQFHIAPLYKGEDVSQVGDSGSLVVTSFRPLELQRRVETLWRWLRTCCDSKAVDLICADMDRTFDGWKKYCRHGDKCRECCGICKIVCDLKSPECCDPQGQQSPRAPAALEKYIDERLKEVVPCCKKIEGDLNKAVLCAKYLEQMLQNCQQSGGYTPGEYGNKLRGALGSLGSLGQGAKEKMGLENRDSVIRKICDSIIHCGAPGPIEQCEEIVALLLKLKKVVDELGDCLVLCREVEGAFKAWKAQLGRITEAEAFFLKLCQLLEKELGGGTCKRPGEIIEKIDRELPRLTVDNCPEDRGADTGGPDKRAASVDSEAPVCTEFLRKLQKALEKPEAPTADWFLEVLKERLTMKELLGAVLENAKKFLAEQCEQDDRDVNRVYYAVGMMFAGDTPGSPFGEFALASDISTLAENLRFSLRPVFEPRSSFRELRVRPPAEIDPVQGPLARRGRAPGEPGGDSRGGGPQPEGESAQGNPGGG